MPDLKVDVQEVCDKLIDIEDIEHCQICFAWKKLFTTYLPEAGLIANHNITLSDNVSTTLIKL